MLQDGQQHPPIALSQAAGTRNAPDTARCRSGHKSHWLKTIALAVNQVMEHQPSTQLDSSSLSVPAQTSRVAEQTSPAPNSSFQIPCPRHLHGESSPPPGAVCGGPETMPKQHRACIKHSRNGVYNYKNLDYLNLRTSCSCPDLHHKRTLCPFLLFPGGRAGREGGRELSSSVDGE